MGDQATTQDGVGPLSIYRDAVEAQYGQSARYELALLLMGAERQLVGVIGAALKEFGLTRAQWSVLAILHLSPNSHIPLGRIAQALGVHGTIITNAVDRLVSLGLAERAVDSRDRRSVQATITPSGIKRSDAIFRDLSQQQFGLGALSATEVKTLTRLIAKLSPMA
jgi:DNA-binding MarR family transcriptional regulator